jgi:hypothetical protein
VHYRLQCGAKRSYRAHYWWVRDKHTCRYMSARTHTDDNGATSSSDNIDCTRALVEDVQLYIAEHLDNASLYCLSMVNTTWRRVCARLVRMRGVVVRAWHKNDDGRWQMAAPVSERALVCTHGRRRVNSARPPIRARAIGVCSHRRRTLRTYVNVVTRMPMKRRGVCMCARRALNKRSLYRLRIEWANIPTGADFVIKHSKSSKTNVPHNYSKLQQTCMKIMVFSKSKK